MCRTLRHDLRRALGSPSGAVVVNVDRQRGRYGCPPGDARLLEGPHDPGQSHPVVSGVVRRDAAVHLLLRSARHSGGVGFLSHPGHGCLQDRNGPRFSPDASQYVRDGTPPATAATHTNHSRWNDSSLLVQWLLHHFRWEHVFSVGRRILLLLLALLCSRDRGTVWPRHSRGWAQVAHCADPLCHTCRPRSAMVLRDHRRSRAARRSSLSPFRDERNPAAGTPPSRRRLRRGGGRRECGTVGVVARALLLYPEPDELNGVHQLRHFVTPQCLHPTRVVCRYWWSRSAATDHRARGDRTPLGLCHSKP